MIKVYIEDFNQLSDKEIILYTGEVDARRLKERFADDCIGDIRNFDEIMNCYWFYKLMLIETHNLKVPDYDAPWYITEGYTILTLHEDRHGAYYVEIDI